MIIENMFPAHGQYFAMFIFRPFSRFSFRFRLSLYYYLSSNMIAIVFIVIDRRPTLSCQKIRVLLVFFLLRDFFLKS